MNSKQKPAHEVRLGKIRATLWANNGDKGTLYNVTFSRLYKDDSNNWKDSTSFSRDDLPIVEKAAAAAFSWIHQQRAEQQVIANEEAK